MKYCIKYILGAIDININVCIADVIAINEKTEPIKNITHVMIPENSPYRPKKEILALMGSFDSVFDKYNIGAYLTIKNMIIDMNISKIESNIIYL